MKQLHDPHNSKRYSLKQGNVSLEHWLLFIFSWTEINILWAIHQVHHSSEDYNWAVGFRMSMFQRLAHFGFYQPLALLGIPLPAVLVHTGLNYVAQFWVHNSLIGNLGPLEGVITTPSTHRVHHGKLGHNGASSHCAEGVLF